MRGVVAGGGCTSYWPAAAMVKQLYAIPNQPATRGVLLANEKYSMARSFNWPEKGNKAFASAEDGAYFHVPSIRNFHPPHAQAFKEAAETVIDKMEADGDRPTNDIYIFPVLYLYRHGIEINLKSLIQVGINLKFFERDAVQAALDDHNLAKLWNHAKKLLLHRWSESNPAPLKATESVINGLHQSDPNGQVFRYAFDKAGKRHRYDRLPDHISVTTLKKTMDGVFNFLESTWSALEDDCQSEMQSRRQYKCEMESEMRAEYERDMRSEYGAF
jgi:hypothetical protein